MPSGLDHLAHQRVITVDPDTDRDVLTVFDGPAERDPALAQPPRLRSRVSLQPAPSSGRTARDGRRLLYP